jgi:predicted nucleic acid-binding protein
VKDAYILDSFAVLAYHYGERGKEKVKELLLKSEKGDTQGYFHWINAGEVYYILHREEGEGIANRAIALIKRWPISLVLPDEGNFLLAARIKAKHPISYADAFVVATALSKEGRIVTGDPEFKKVEKVAPILWIKEI